MLQKATVQEYKMIHSEEPFVHELVTDSGVLPCPNSPKELSVL